MFLIDFNGGVKALFGVVGLGLVNDEGKDFTDVVSDGKVDAVEAVREGRVFGFESERDLLEF